MESATHHHHRNHVLFERLERTRRVHTIETMRGDDADAATNQPTAETVVERDPDATTTMAQTDERRPTHSISPTVCAAVIFIWLVRAFDTSIYTHHTRYNTDGTRYIYMYTGGFINTMKFNTNYAIHWIIVWTVNDRPFIHNHIRIKYI